MLWSLVKVLSFVAVIAALTFGAMVLLNLGGGIQIAVAGMEFTLGPLQAVIVGLLLLALVWLVVFLLGLLVATLRFLNGDETAISRYFSRNRERRGFEALAEGMMALASGDGRVAQSRAARAERYLGRPELTGLLAAQAAEMTGDTRKASEVYKTLLGDERTRFVGVRGILKQTLADGDNETALKLAKKAFALKPRHAETQDLLLKLQAEQSDWAGARSTMAAKAKSRSLPRDVARRRDAVLALQQAKDVFASGSTIEAREAAIAANRQSPDLIPGAALAARTLVAEGNKKHATRVLKKAWEAQPHPDLAAAFAEIEPGETPDARLKRFAALTRSRADHEETRLLLAELNIAAEQFPAARRAIGDLAQSHPTARALTIMAAIERGEGAPDAVVRGWLTRALTASRGPQWTCSVCHNIHASWVPICENCAAFDSLAWVEAPGGTGPSATGTELLPLLVGEPGAGPAVADAEIIEPAKARSSP